MRLPRFFKATMVIFLSILMSQVTAVAAEANVNTVPAMLPTSAFIEKLDAEQVRTNVKNFLSRDDVQKALEKQGLSKDEISSRLASLSPSELQALNAQMNQNMYGGDILWTILIIVLIIFLIKRI